MCRVWCLKQPSQGDEPFCFNLLKEARRVSMGQQTAKKGKLSDENWNCLTIHRQCSRCEVIEEESTLQARQAKLRVLNEKSIAAHPKSSLYAEEFSSDTPRFLLEPLQRQVNRKSLEKDGKSRAYEWRLRRRIFFHCFLNDNREFQSRQAWTQSLCNCISLDALFSANCFEEIASHVRRREKAL